MKIGRFLLLFVLAMGMAIVFSDRGLRDNLAMRERLMALHKTNQDIARENASLSQTVRLLTDDLGYIERVARNELGMVKKGDIVTGWNSSASSFRMAMVNFKDLLKRKKKPLRAVRRPRPPMPLPQTAKKIDFSFLSRLDFQIPPVRQEATRGPGYRFPTP